MENPVDMYMSKRSVGDAMYDFMLKSGVEKRAMVFFAKSEDFL